MLWRTGFVPFLLLALGAAGVSAGEPGPAGAPILRGTSPWRVRYLFGEPLAQTDGGFAPLGPAPDSRLMNLVPPPEWTAPGFDDSGWSRRFFVAGLRQDPGLRQYCVRGKFTVADPAQVKALRLDLAFHGGAAVYVNGVEAGRAGLPDGRIEPKAPALPYPPGAYGLSQSADGTLGVRADLSKPEVQAELAQLRVRRIERLAVPARLLRKGTNVLALEIHAACFPKGASTVGNKLPRWDTCALLDVALTADAADGVTPNVGRPKGIQVWTTNMLDAVYDVEWADPSAAAGAEAAPEAEGPGPSARPSAAAGAEAAPEAEGPGPSARPSAAGARPIILAGARNGSYMGRVALTAADPIQNVRAAMSDLRGPAGAVLPASAARVSYGDCDFADNLSNQMYPGLGARRDDALLDAPPAIEPLNERVLQKREAAGFGRGCLRGVYVTVRVPRDAVPGDYEGALTVSADGLEPARKVPVRLTVVDWTLPDPKDFTFFTNITESPQSVALYYREPFGTERHWTLVGKSLDLLAALGGRVLYVPLVAEGPHGNEHSMVLWVKDGKGGHTYDFSRVERYVDEAIAHGLKLKYVSFVVWDLGGGSYAGAAPRSAPRFTALDPETGKLENLDGPKYGTPECEAFWRPVLTGIYDRMGKRHLADAMLLGTPLDRPLDPATVRMFYNIVPQVGWQVLRHPSRFRNAGSYGSAGPSYLRMETGPKKPDERTVPIRCETNVYGNWSCQALGDKRVYGWQNPDDRTWNLRRMGDEFPLPVIRSACEQCLIAGYPGIGSTGLDFWPVAGLKGTRRSKNTIYNRYPGAVEYSLASELLHLAGAGPDGAVPSVRYEMFRESIQECEARIALEKLLTAQPCPLPADAARKFRELLDERTRAHIGTTFYMQYDYGAGGSAMEPKHASSNAGWQERSIELYQACAEAAKLVRPKS